jgi:hypothetical protein
MRERVQKKNSRRDPLDNVRKSLKSPADFRARSRCIRELIKVNRSDQPERHDLGSNAAVNAFAVPASSGAFRAGVRLMPPNDRLAQSASAYPYAFRWYHGGLSPRTAAFHRGRGKTHLQRTAGQPPQSDCGRVCELIQALRPGSPAAAVRHQ